MLHEMSGDGYRQIPIDSFIDINNLKNSKCNKEFTDEDGYECDEHTALTGIPDEDGKDENKSWKKEVNGFLVGILASLCLTASASCVRALKKNVPDFEKNGLRFVAVFMTTVPYFAWKKTIPSLTSSNRSLWFGGFVWCATGIISLYGNYTSVIYISLGKSTSISRIVGTGILAIASWTFYKEKVKKMEVLSLILAFIGVIMVYQEEVCETCKHFIHICHHRFQQDNVTIILSDSGTEVVRQYHTSYIVSTGFGMFLAVLGGGAEAFHFMVQKSNLQDVSVMVLCWWYSLMGIASSFVISSLIEVMSLPLTLHDWIFLTGHCFGSAAFAILSTVAQNMASFIIVALSFGSQLGFYFLAQFFIFGEVSSGVGLYVEIAGAVITVISACLVPLHQLVVNKF